MLGLRTQESKKFENYFALVQTEARKQNSVYFFDTGEGRDIETDTLEGEDLSGWLIPNEKAEAFEKEWKDFHNPLDEWNDYYTFAIWSKPNNITITFK